MGFLYVKVLQNGYEFLYAIHSDENEEIRNRFKKAPWIDALTAREIKKDYAAIIHGASRALKSMVTMHEVAFSPSLTALTAAAHIDYDALAALIYSGQALVAATPGKEELPVLQTPIGDFHLSLLNNNSPQVLLAKTFVLASLFNRPTFSFYRLVEALNKQPGNPVKLPLIYQPTAKLMTMLYRLPTKSFSLLTKDFFKSKKNGLKQAGEVYKAIGTYVDHDAFFYSPTHGSPFADVMKQRINDTVRDFIKKNNIQLYVNGGGIEKYEKYKAAVRTVDKYFLRSPYFLKNIKPLLSGNSPLYNQELHNYLRSVISMCREQNIIMPFPEMVVLTLGLLKHGIQTGIQINPELHKDTIMRRLAVLKNDNGYKLQTATDEATEKMFAARVFDIAEAREVYGQTPLEHINDFVLAGGDGTRFLLMLRGLYFALTNKKHSPFHSISHITPQALEYLANESKYFPEEFHGIEEAEPGKNLYDFLKFRLRTSRDKNMKDWVLKDYASAIEALNALLLLPNVYDALAPLLRQNNNDAFVKLVKDTEAARKWSIAELSSPAHKDDYQKVRQLNRMVFDELAVSNKTRLVTYVKPVAYLKAFSGVAKLFTYEILDKIFQLPVFNYIMSTGESGPVHKQHTAGGDFYPTEDVRHALGRLLNEYEGLIKGMFPVLAYSKNDFSNLPEGLYDYDVVSAFVNYLSVKAIRASETAVANHERRTLGLMLKDEQQIHILRELMQVLRDNKIIDESIDLHYIDRPNDAVPLSSQDGNILFDPSGRFEQTSTGHGPAFIKAIRGMRERLGIPDGKPMAMSFQNVDNCGSKIYDFTKLTQQACFAEHTIREELIFLATYASKPEDIAAFLDMVPLSRQNEAAYLKLYKKQGMVAFVAQFVQDRWGVLLDQRDPATKDLIIDNVQYVQEKRLSLAALLAHIQAMPITAAIVVEKDKGDKGGGLRLDARNNRVLIVDKADREDGTLLFNPLLFSTLTLSKPELDLENGTIFISDKTLIDDRDQIIQIKQAESASTHIATDPRNFMTVFIRVPNTQRSEAFQQNKTIDETHRSKVEGLWQQLRTDFEHIAQRIGHDPLYVAKQVNFAQTSWVRQYHRELNRALQEGK